MPLDTETTVSSVKNVEDERGNEASPATEKSARGRWKHGGSFDSAKDGYGLAFSPSEPIYDLVIFQSGDDIEADILTTGGSEFTVPLNGIVGSLPVWEIEEITFRDPFDTGARTIAAWGGDAE